MRQRCWTGGGVWGPLAVGVPRGEPLKIAPAQEEASGGWEVGRGGGGGWGVVSACVYIHEYICMYMCV